jgi:hypothetical protein
MPFFHPAPLDHRLRALSVASKSIHQQHEPESDDHDADEHHDFKHYSATAVIRHAKSRVTDILTSVASLDFVQGFPYTVRPIPLPWNDKIAGPEGSPKSDTNSTRPSAVSTVRSTPSPSTNA